MTLLFDFLSASAYIDHRYAQTEALATIPKMQYGSHQNLKIENQLKPPNLMTRSREIILAMA
jgi:hypothetical protein